MLVSVSFGDFKPNELPQLINSKDPLGLNTDSESYFTSKGSNFEAKATTSEAIAEPNATSMEYDPILHYLKMTSSMAPINNRENITTKYSRKYQ